MFLYTSDLYENVRLKINCIRHYFTLYPNQVQVNCIKDGRSTNYTISEFQKIKNGWACLYDFCLLNIPKETYKCEKYRYNVVRLCPKKTYNEEHIEIEIAIEMVVFCDDGRRIWGPTRLYHSTLSGNSVRNYRFLY